MWYDFGCDSNELKLNKFSLLETWIYGALIIKNYRYEVSDNLSKKHISSIVKVSKVLVEHSVLNYVCQQSMMTTDMYGNEKKRINWSESANASISFLEPSVKSR